MRFLFRAALFLGLIGVLVACGGRSQAPESADPQPGVEAKASPAPVVDAPTAETEPTSTPEQVAAAPTARPTSEPEAAPTEAPAVQETPDWSRNAWLDGDLYVLGNPEAPIRLVDYSDFL